MNLVFVPKYQLLVFSSDLVPLRQTAGGGGSVRAAFVQAALMAHYCICGVVTLQVVKREATSGGFHAAFWSLMKQTQISEGPERLIALLILY